MKIKKYLNFSLKDTLISIAVLALAVTASCVFYENLKTNVIMIFILSVILISRFTKGYLYGILAATVSVLAVNCFFAFPYGKINFLLDGYPVTYITMFVVAIITSALTTGMQRQAQKAQESEKTTKELFEQNKKLEDEQKQIIYEAEKEKMRGNLLRAVSHDLRTPLTAISGASAVLLENNEKLSQDEKQALLKDISDDATWLIRMVENLLSVTRIKDGVTKIKKSEEVAEEVIAESVYKIKRRYPESKIKVTVPDELLMVPMDAMLIEQVIINLIENAIKHSCTKDDIILSVTVEGENAVFYVKDFGCGIKSEELENILFAFSGKNEKNADSSRDMGIGLSVCMTIVKAHGGEFIVDSQEGKGSTFGFTLPLGVSKDLEN